MPAERLALFTTVYPGVEKYLAEWFRSISRQTDHAFDLWIAVDALSKEDVTRAIGIEPRATWVHSHEGDTPAQLRQRALSQIVEQYEAVVCVDSDDLLLPDRIEAARAALAHYDLTGCALTIVGEAGDELGPIFAPDRRDDLGSLLPRYNVFGLSNTAYRSETLSRSLPLPAGCVLVDWLLATRAWASGASLHFDFTPRMAYRQYSSNVARVVPPFSQRQVQQATERVLSHYRCALESDRELPEPQHQMLAHAARRAEEFHKAITLVPRVLKEYVEALNRLEPKFIWWWSVAHPDLEEIWRS
jgi:hypothetical protein